MLLYPMDIHLTVWRDVRNECEIPAGWYDEDGVFQAYDMAGRTLVFKARSPDARGATVIINSASDASTCAPRSGATDVVHIVIPSDVATGLAAGTYECAVVDTTDSATDAENLIAAGSMTVKNQAVW